ncbi:hypothetical protein [Parasedimentitalea maritima]|uniref:Uncharacterized protein n=1 Tax=Parasedimentitalea maritima TaxID=2578117 RepID=A0A6A4R8I9_9RHOB|nr:hypothetical protein [Zongyanglinia marina]KAE9627900.1 hypothetical protein GP644_17540 [Zongyanglinia marina]
MIAKPEDFLGLLGSPFLGEPFAFEKGPVQTEVGEAYPWGEFGLLALDFPDRGATVSFCDTPPFSCDSVTFYENAPKDASDQVKLSARQPLPDGLHWDLTVDGVRKILGSPLSHGRGNSVGLSIEVPWGTNDTLNYKLQNALYVSFAFFDGKLYSVEYSDQALKPQRHDPMETWKARLIMGVAVMFGGLVFWLKQ